MPQRSKPTWRDIREGKMALFHVEQCEDGEACERQPRRREARVKFCFRRFCPIQREGGAPTPHAGSSWQTVGDMAIARVR